MVHFKGKEGKRHFQKKVVLVVLLTLPLSSEEFLSSTSMQGYTGLINTPNAQVMKEGDISFSFNNQFDNHLRGYDYSKPKDYAEDYIFSVGLLPNLEIQGRFKEQPGYTRDLSANVKYQLPISYQYLPDIAIGVQDLGSAANNYENYYIVMDKSFWRLRTSLGYGYSHISSPSKAERMDGVFGGVEAMVTPWLHILGEYDSEETHVAARTFLPSSWFNGVQINLTLASNLSDDGDTSFMIEALFPFGRGKVIEEKEDQGKQAEADMSGVTPHETVEEDHDRDPLQRLAGSLEKEGLKNITVGTEGKSLYIAYENTVYLHNELDAMAAVIKYASSLSQRYDTFIIAIKHSDIIISEIKGSLKFAAQYLKEPTEKNKMLFRSSLQSLKGERSAERNIVVSDMSSTTLWPQVVITPLLTTFVGTELSAFDYQLLMGTKAYLHLYKGIDLTLRYDIPISYSDNLDPKDGYFRYAYSDGGLFSSMINYSAYTIGGLNTLSAGLYDYDYLGIMDQFMYRMEDQSFKVKLGYFQHKDWSDITKEVYLATYTYHYTPMDIFLEVKGGKYWHQDTGFGLSFKRFFGDVAVELSYLQTAPEDYTTYSEDINQYVGIGIEIPLDFGKSKLSGKYGQINGDTAWRYRLRTTVAREDGSNRIVPINSGLDPLMSMEMENYFYNRNRMSIEYIKDNSNRLFTE